MRKRTTQQETTLPGYTAIVTNYGGYSGTVSSVPSSVFTSRFKEMWDWHGRAKGRWNPCYVHDKFEVRHLGPSPYEVDSSPGTPQSYSIRIKPYEWSTGLQAQIASNPLHDALYPSYLGECGLDTTKCLFKRLPGLSGLAAEAATAMMPGVATRMSLVNSILELKDFKRPLRKLKEFVGVIRRPGALNKLRNLVGNTPLREVPRIAAGAYLEYQFAWAPLCRDIASFIEAVSHYRAEVKRLLDQEGKVQLSHYGRPIIWPESTVETNWIQDPTVSTCQRGVKCELSFWDASYHATMEYSFRLSDYARNHAYELGWQDALGVNYNPAIIWNAIPFSFVVDWVLGVNRYLENFKEVQLKPIVTVRRFMHSVKLQYYLDSITLQRTPHCTMDKPISRVGYTLYHREPVYDVDYLKALRTSGVSSKEFTLAVSLLLANCKRRL